MEANDDVIDAGRDLLTYAEDVFSRGIRSLEILRWVLEVVAVVMDDARKNVREWDHVDRFDRDRGRLPDPISAVAELVANSTGPNYSAVELNYTCKSFLCKHGQVLCGIYIGNILQQYYDTILQQYDLMFNEWQAIHYRQTGFFQRLRIPSQRALKTRNHIPLRPPPSPELMALSQKLVHATDHGVGGVSPRNLLEETYRKILDVQGRSVAALRRLYINMSQLKQSLDRDTTLRIKRMWMQYSDREPKHARAHQEILMLIRTEQRAKRAEHNSRTADAVLDYLRNGELSKESKKIKIEGKLGHSISTSTMDRLCEHQATFGRFNLKERLLATTYNAMMAEFAPQPKLRGLHEDFLIACGWEKLELLADVGTRLGELSADLKDSIQGFNEIKIPGG